MSKSMTPTLRIPITPDFFCDGKFYVLTSSSLGGSHLTVAEISDILGDGNSTEIKELLQQGVCLPLFFDADCELDNKTLFVIGDLTEEENAQWIGRIVSKLHIPCGKLVLLCGGGDPDFFTQAISGQPPQKEFIFFQTIDVPAGAYQVEVYAYLSSFIAQDYLDTLAETAQDWFRTHCPGTISIQYIIRLAPFSTDLPLPQQIPDIGWCGEFEFRQPETP